MQRYIWRWRARLGDYYGQRCVVIARGTMNSCLVQFDNGARFITSRNGIRRTAKPTPSVAPGDER